MKSTIKKIAIAGAVVAFVATMVSIPTQADNLRLTGNNPFNFQSGFYTNGAGQVIADYYSIYGTNDNAGYTNAEVAVPTPGSIVNFNVHMQGYSVNFSNAVTLVVGSSQTGATYDEATTKLRYAIVPNGNTVVVTNITLSSWGAPYARITLENPASNPVSITNLNIYVQTKAP